MMPFSFFDRDISDTASDLRMDALITVSRATSIGKSCYRERKRLIIRDIAFADRRLL